MLVADPGHAILSGNDAPAAVAALEREGLVAGRRPDARLERLVGIVVGGERRVTLDVSRGGEELAYRAWVSSAEAVLGREEGERLELAFCRPLEVPATLARRVRLDSAAPRVVWPRPLAARRRGVERALGASTPDEADRALREAETLGPIERAFLLRGLGSPRLGWKLTASFRDETGEAQEERLAVVDAGAGGLWIADAGEERLELTAVGADDLWRRLVTLCGGVLPS